jgi:NAD(P)H-hydrate epimerase
MLPVLDAARMRDADRRTIEEVGLPGAVLMENAGSAVARLLRERFPSARRVAILCGKGNNGGDGFVAARRLRELDPAVSLVGSRADVKGDARLHLGVLERSGGHVQELADAAAWQRVRDDVFRSDVIVDALLGTGLDQAPAGPVGVVIHDLVALGRRSGAPPVIAVDLPSGMSADAGEVAWETPRAALTVTFGALKYPHVLPPACDRVGDVVVVDIGIPRSALENTAPQLYLIERADAAAAFPAREPGGHKGTYGHVLVIAGSVGKTGAAVLTAWGALAAGAGLVTVATAETALPSVAAGRPEIMTEPLHATAAGAIDREALKRALALAKTRDAVVLGPGLGQEASTREFVREFVRRCATPLVVDADGLNALAGSGKVAPAADALQREAATIVTPHPGEMARLTGAPTDELQRRRLESARALALQTGATVVLKGQRTLIADGSGRAAVNPTGNPGMGTGGTGDALAGIMGAVVARHRDAWLAATAAVYLHGVAGDCAARRLGQESMAAGDLIESLPEAFRGLTGERPLRGSEPYLST